MILTPSGVLVGTDKMTVQSSSLYLLECFCWLQEASPLLSCLVPSLYSLCLPISMLFIVPNLLSVSWSAFVHCMCAHAYVLFVCISVLVLRGLCSGLLIDFRGCSRLGEYLRNGCISVGFVSCCYLEPWGIYLAVCNDCQMLSVMSPELFSCQHVQGPIFLL